eukprot:CAMPEP_0119544106 /NCGR_PEP_ID=MMETSP1344-20130328/54542_1 /TAXON_ID=236787 /ORGANISM="Florenciella parvula, Strain CCMP2471" /LENGTH=98 /DNA_ID=CAMNT_0007588561 /DNA_START=226 /DNA_END=519 /DNA_ORIENTATION=+
MTSDDADQARCCRHRSAHVRTAYQAAPSTEIGETAPTFARVGGSPMSEVAMRGVFVGTKSEPEEPEGLSMTQPFGGTSADGSLGDLHPLGSPVNPSVR